MTESVLDRDERRTRVETAALLRSIAADFETGVSFGVAEDATVGVPEEMDVTLELEREATPEGDGGEAFELEVEIEWTDADLPNGVEAHGETDASPIDDATAAGEAGDEADAAFDATDVAPGAPSDATSETAEAAEEAAPPSLAGFQVYRDRGGEWRWRLVHRNGNIIATSGEGYTSRQNAEKGMRSVMRNAPGAEMTRERD